jgi:hypothetical protein
MSLLSFLGFGNSGKDRNRKLKVGTQVSISDLKKSGYQNDGVTRETRGYQAWYNERLKYSVLYEPSSREVIEAREGSYVPHISPEHRAFLLGNGIHPYNPKP